MSKNLNFGEALKHYRLARGYSQQGLGDLIEVTFQTVNRWENQHHIPNVRSINKLEGALGLKPGDLLRLVSYA